MILRRLASAITEQNWFTVVLEVLIVVVGIFIGLQVDDWNQGRLDRIEERAFLERLALDMQASIEETQSDIDYMKTNADKTAMAVDAMISCDLAPENRDNFASALYQIGKISPSFLVRGTIDELRSTGKISIIRNIKLRQDFIELLQHHEERQYIVRVVFDRLQPHVTYTDSKVLFDIRNSIVNDDNITWDKINVDLPALCEDRRFSTALTANLNYTWSVVSQNQTTIDTLQELKTRIGLELSR